MFTLEKRETPLQSKNQMESAFPGFQEPLLRETMLPCGGNSRSKFRMRAPHDLDAILPEDTCKCFDLPAQLLISPIMTAADPEVDRLRMQLYDPLHLFLEPLVIFHGMPAAAAPHESLDLQRLLPVAGKGPRPLVERLKASRPRADTACLKTC